MREGRWLGGLHADAMLMQQTNNAMQQNSIYTETYPRNKTATMSKTWKHIHDGTRRASEALGLALHLPVHRLTPLRIEGDGDDLRAIEKTQSRRRQMPPAD